MIYTLVHDTMTYFNGLYPESIHNHCPDSLSTPILTYYDSYNKLHYKITGIKRKNLDYSLLDSSKSHDFDHLVFRKSIGLGDGSGNEAFIWIPPSSKKTYSGSGGNRSTIYIGGSYAW